ncbi:SPFH domain-containing protein [Dictyobacter formicarum]|uniref:Band 7 domain-containing protein n=1 Tax=Dictyobacter formicarum TaxID=2778368 RepID=A0ABQ3VKW5_9CHLR|nr:SPFH domain-containing protein [Dictyobacter formicarum]GHO86852.1 hypothetical protein KSZ_48580 [Dictyobacter formicarum]
MSSDRKDPGDSWQDSPGLTSNWPQQQQEEQFPVVDGELIGARGEPLEDDGEALQPGGTRRQYAGRRAKATPAELASSFFESFNHVNQYVTLILLPLVFCGLACLLVLPQVASGHAVLAPAGFWPILIVLLAITIVQAVMVYYAGSDNGMWTLGTAGGLCLFLLATCFALYGLLPGLLVLVALIALGITLARRCVHPVPEGFVDIVYSFKKYTRTLYPGFNILLLWEEITQQLNVEEIQWMCPAQIVQISRDEDVMLRGVISYQLLPEDAYLAVTQVRNWEESLRARFQTMLQTITTVFQPEDLLVWPDGRSGHMEQPGDDDFVGGFERREQINDYLLQLMREKVALWGVQINWVSIRDIEIAPHGAIKIEPVQPVLTSRPATVPAATPGSATEKTAPEMPVPRTSAQQGQPVEAPARPHHLEEGTPAPPSYDLTEDVLVHAYKDVQDGRITDPETIRGIAAKFYEVAQDPEASQKVHFDAAQAARNLYEEAKKHEQRYPGKTYHDATQPNWVMQHPKDKNLMTGG